MNDYQELSRLGEEWVYKFTAAQLTQDEKIQLIRELGTNAWKVIEEQSGGVIPNAAG